MSIARASRLIPAHAGSTRPHAPSWRSWTAHPRSRGEHTRRPPRRRAEGGSSPLTRGARRAPRRSRHTRGLIPAHAGSTLISTPSGPRCQAHPRSRGEHRWTRRGTFGDDGSSPLTRGAQPTILQILPRPRLIPAHAGSTDAHGTRACLRPAHPRSRGEHEVIHSSDPVTVGSSPLTRGAPDPPSPQPRRMRLIPAHAGSTRCP